MNRRIAWIVGLALCLGLLVQFALRPGADAPAQRARQFQTPVPRDASSSNVLPNTDGDAAAAVTASPIVDDKRSGGTFQGRVIDAVTRAPVREFELIFLGTPPAENSHPSQTIRAKDGRFAVNALPAGHWVVFAKARRYQRFELDLEIAAGKATQEIVIPMRSGYTLRGRVFDETSRAPIGSANISAREAHIARFEGDFRNRLSATSQTDGSFVLEGLPPGPVTISAHARNYALRELDLTLGEKHAAVEIALSAGGTIAGYLAGPDGLTPTAGNVTLSELEQSSSSSIPTGPAGEFSFQHLQPGRHRLTGRSGGLSGGLDITLSHAEQLEGMVLALNPGHNIRGVVSGVRPEELKLVTVALFREDKFSDSVSVPVDERGAFLLAGVAPGRVQLMADVNVRQLIKQVEMPADTDLTVNLEFPRGARLTGHVSRDGKPLGGVWVSPHSRSSDASQQTHLRGAQASSSGDYVIEDIPNGEYSLYVEGYLTPPMRIAGDTVFDIEVPAAHLAGRVVEDGGKVPIVGALVDIRSAQPTTSGRRLSERSDHFGQFSLRGLQPGDFVLSVYKPGYELYRAPIAYGSPVTDLVIRLRPARGVEVRVVEAGTGKPVQRVSVLETIGGLWSTDVLFQVDENGVGHLPSGMAGSALIFSAPGYGAEKVTDWNGQGLEIALPRQSSP